MTDLYERHAELYDRAFDWDVDRAAGSQQHRSRIELHDLTLWTPETWAAAVAASPFTQTAVFDGAENGYPAVRPGSEGAMLWNELTRED